MLLFQCSGQCAEMLDLPCLLSHVFARRVRPENLLGREEKENDDDEEEGEALCEEPAASVSCPG